MATASAAPIQFLAGGIMSSDPAYAAAAGVPNGTPWSVNFYIDESTPNTGPYIWEGNYLPLTGSLTLGTETFDVSQFANGGKVIVYDGAPTGSQVGADQVNAGVYGNIFDTNGPKIAGHVIANFVVGLMRGGLPTSNDWFWFEGTDLGNVVGLPLVGTCANTDWACLNYQQPKLVTQLWLPGWIELHGSVDYLSVQVVPIPAAAWLFGSALVAMGWMRRVGGVPRH
jgi:hypothetical protein